MSDQIRLRNDEILIDPDILTKVNHVSLLIHDKDGKAVVIGHPKQYLPGGKIEKDETPLDAICRIAQLQLHLDLSDMVHHIHPIFADFIGYPCNKNVSLCFAVFDKAERTLVHDCRIVTNRDIAGGQWIGRLDTLYILTNAYFSQYHEYYGKLRDFIKSNELMRSVVEYEDVH